MVKDSPYLIFVLANTQVQAHENFQAEVVGKHVVFLDACAKSSTIHRTSSDSSTAFASLVCRATN